MKIYFAKVLIGLNPSVYKKKNQYLLFVRLITTTTIKRKLVVLDKC